MVGCEGAVDEGSGPADAPADGSQAQIQASTERERDRRRAATGSVEDRVEDAKLTSRVLIALADDAQLRPYTFSAESIDGRVYVRGHLTSNAHRDRVNDVVSGVRGVRAVINETESDEPRPPQPSIADTDPPEADVEPPTVAEVIPEAEDETPAEPEPAEAAETYHTVRSGESLWTIARQHNTSIANIRRLNNMTSDNLRPGQRIRVR